MNVFEKICVFFSTDLINDSNLTLEINDLIKLAPGRDPNTNEFEIVFKCNNFKIKFTHSFFIFDFMSQ